MGIEALTHKDDGSEVIPVSKDDWRAWVSAGRTRNWMMKDPLIDWLQEYGKSRDYIPKQELDDYAEKTKPLDFLEFIFEKGIQFEEGILNLLKERYEVVTVAQHYKEIQCLDKAKETFEVMQRGAPIIYQAVLRDAQSMTYGSPDFLIRSDVLRDMFGVPTLPRQAAMPAPDLDAANWHYCVVDTKFTTLHLNAAGTEIANDGSASAYKAQLYIYNRMLGRLQGYLPPESYLLGRGWQLTSKGVTQRCPNAMDRLGPIPQDGTISKRVPISAAAEEALDWVRRVRTEGRDWQLVPKPSVPELYPNMSNIDDGDMMMALPDPEDGDEYAESSNQWVGVKKWLADELKELTLLWWVGPSGRDCAHSKGIYRWDDPRLTPDDVEIRGAKTAPTLASLLAVNTDSGPPVRPLQFSDVEHRWRTPTSVEFYVDFEFCSDLNDDFSKLPLKGGQPLIFMIGCGHLENGEWRFKSLTTDDLSEDEELRIIREWTDHMRAVRDRLEPRNGEPRIFHWSPAEVIALETAYNSAMNRHGERADWQSNLGWYDFLKVMRDEPIVVRGAMDFGLKSVAKAMRRHGLIETEWDDDSQVDGLGAMVGAWRCDEEAQRTDASMADLPLMREIAKYNEIDCKVMMEIIRYLRTNH